MNSKNYTELLLKISNSIFLGLVITFCIMFLPIGVSIFFICLFSIKLFINTNSKPFLIFSGILFIVGMIYFLNQPYETIIIQAIIIGSFVIGFHLIDYFIKIPLISFLVEISVFYMFMYDISRYMIQIKEMLL